MNKKQLSKLRRLPATNSMVALAKMPGRKRKKIYMWLEQIQIQVHGKMPVSERHTETFYL